VQIGDFVGKNYFVREALFRRSITFSTVTPWRVAAISIADGPSSSRRFFFPYP
jgi:hypothetical protein